MIYDDARFEAAVADVVRPSAREVDERAAFPSESLRALANAGLYGLMVPREMGGSGASAATFATVARRLGGACASTAMVFVMHVTSVNALVHQGDERQRRRYLDPVVEGRWLVTEAISEPGSGSQWWSIASTARRLPGGGYRIDARKSFATSAGHADLYMVSTRAPGFDDPTKHALFAIEADRAGIEHGGWDALGLRGSSSGPIRFSLDVDEEAMIFGADEAGLRLYNEINQPLYHLGIGSVYLGIVDACLEGARDRIRSRRYAADASGYGTNLSDFPVTRRHLGEMSIARVALESAVLRLAADIESGTPFEALAIPMTAVKVLGAEIAASVARQGLMACGGAAFSRSPMTMERHMRDAAAGSLMGPNDDFCKEIIGRLALGIGSYHDLGT